MESVAAVGASTSAQEGAAGRGNQSWGPRQLGRDLWALSLWAPEAGGVSAVLGGRSTPLMRDAGGVWRGEVRAAVQDTYRFEVDGQSIPDPASRLQSGDVHAASALCQPLVPSFWPGRDWAETVLYELHIGTFTDAGTFAAAAERLPDLAALGITAVEIMPVAQFSGSHGWGYDGVLPYAVHPAYGTREDLARFVERAHANGISVLLDVVYNHFGPEGAYIHATSPEFFAADRQTPWGPAIDFTQAAVRDYFIDNALMWLEEFGIDGFRFDAVHQIVDPSERAFMKELCETIRARDFGRPIHLVAEDERNLPELRETGLMTAQWNDDYHHAVHCLLTGEATGYYASFAVDPMGDLTRALAEGHVEQGQRREGLEGRRGAPSAHLPSTAFVNANQTHDQIGNRAEGERLITLAGEEPMRIAHALLLAAPAIPMLFMGEEAGSRSPFQFFADFRGDLADAVRKGRAEEFADFEAFQGSVPDPLSLETFRRSRPFADLAGDAEDWQTLTREVLALRHARIVPLIKSGLSGAPEVERLGDHALRGHWRFGAGALTISANLGGPALPAWQTPGADFRIGTGADDYAIGIEVAA